MSIRTWFEIGHDDGDETYTVGSFDTLSAARKSWADNGYSKAAGYFIDVWEEGPDEFAEPVGQIVIE